MVSSRGGGGVISDSAGDRPGQVGFRGKEARLRALQRSQQVLMSARTKAVATGLLGKSHFRDCF